MTEPGRSPDGIDSVLKNGGRSSLRPPGRRTEFEDGGQGGARFLDPRTEDGAFIKLRPPGRRKVLWDGGRDAGRRQDGAYRGTMGRRAIDGLPLPRPCGPPVHPPGVARHRYIIGQRNGTQRHAEVRRTTIDDIEAG
eukprot:gene10961-biopygen4086